MKLRLHDIHLPMRHPFTIALGTTTVQHNLLVELEQGGVIGYGEGASSHAYEAFTADSMRQALESARPIIESTTLTEPTALWDQLLSALGHNRFALCALDEAAHDLWGKLRSAPVWKLWGLELKDLPDSDYTIGIDTIETMVAKLKEFDGWPIYKIKLGTDNDLDIVRELRRHTDAIFRIDANTAWTAEQTIAIAPALKALGVEFLEQPLKRDDWDGESTLTAPAA
jgi:L-alanine-DL-glutamate epimerase-like enolase superfamily enzyme